MGEILYVCDCCKDNAPEGCGRHDRTELRDIDGYWLCEDCFGEHTASDLGVDGEKPEWSHLPPPPEYVPAAERDAATERAEKAEAERDVQAAAHTDMLNRVAALHGALRWAMQENNEPIPAEHYRAIAEAWQAFGEWCGELPPAPSAPPAPAVSQAAADVLAEKFVDAAARVSMVDRIQGFDYGSAEQPNYVVRDVYLDPGEQALWRGESHEEMMRQCEIASVKLILADLERLDRAAAGDEREG